MKYGKAVNTRVRTCGLCDQLYEARLTSATTLLDADGPLVCPACAPAAEQVLSRQHDTEPSVERVVRPKLDQATEDGLVPEPDTDRADLAELEQAQLKADRAGLVCLLLKIVDAREAERFGLKKMRPRSAGPLWLPNQRLLEIVRRHLLTDRRGQAPGYDPIRAERGAYLYYLAGQPFEAVAEILYPSDTELTEEELRRAAKRAENLVLRYRQRVDKFLRMRLLAAMGRLLKDSSVSLASDDRKLAQAA